MGASADQIERQIEETRARMDENLSVLEQQTKSNAVRYGRIAAVVAVVAVAAAGAFILYRRTRRPTLRDRLDALSLESLRDSAAGAGDRLRRSLPTVRVTVNEKEEEPPGLVESMVRRAAPALVGTASSALIDRVIRMGEPQGAQAAPAD